MSTVRTQPQLPRTDAKGSRSSRRCAILLLTTAAASALAACSHDAPVNAPSSARIGNAEQAIVERSSEALQRLRQNPRFAKMEFYLQRARAVLIFPRLVKASLIFGGEGGNGVLVARKPDGTWSAPAFYSLGSPSVGFQIGYQQATVVLFIMDDATLENALKSSVALGAKAGVTLGEVEEPGGTRGEVMTANIYQVVDADGVFAGVSLDGYVIGARARHNLEYYGKSVTPRQILLEAAAERPEAAVLSRALASTP